MKKNTRINRTVQEFVYMLIAQTGMSQEQTNTTIETVITYFRKQPGTDPLTRLIAFFFGDSMKDEQPSVN
ncbi:MAG TPA: hypothetical protein VJT83_02255 [Chitinophagaceae bacterium]|nr:hypothetical protein [Chitinophagaceae bacterium]